MAPFKSKSQMRQMYAKEPLIAERWAKESKQDYSKLPERVKRKKLSSKVKLSVSGAV